ncbi:MAG: adenylyltransferase, partial [Pseudomonadota bacterium]
MPTPTDKASQEEQDQLFRLLRQLDLAPDAPQRETAAAVRLSLGRLNSLIRHATDSGFVKVVGRDNPDKRRRYAYSLTPKGGAEKNRLIDAFLQRKFEEYAALHAELTGVSLGTSPLKLGTKLMQNNLAPIPELFVSYDSAQKLKVE